MLGFRRHAKPNQAICTHAKALPRWDKVEETGDLERVSGYYCPTCDQFLPPDHPPAGTGPAAAPTPG